MTTLHIASEFSSDLRLRNTATLMFRKAENLLEESTEISFDFARVEFISRAFADQFVKELANFENTGKAKVIIENISFPVHEMIKTVQETQTDRKVRTSNIQNIRFETVESIRDFMLAW